MNGVCVCPVVDWWPLLVYSGLPPVEENTLLTARILFGNITFYSTLFRFSTCCKCDRELKKYDTKINYQSRITPDFFFFISQI